MPTIKSLQSPLGSKYFLFLQNENFVDCMLVADGHQIKAHQIVLAASSTYFEQTFAITTVKYPSELTSGKILEIFLKFNFSVITLPDIPQKFLAMILELIYIGKIEVDLKDLMLFQRALNLLKIGFAVEENLPEVKIKEEATEHCESPENFSFDDGIFYEETYDSSRDLQEPMMKKKAKEISYKSLVPTWMQPRQRITLNNVVKNVHTWEMMNTYPETCPFCKKCTKTTKHRNEHVKYCFKNPDRIISECSFCNKKFCDPYYLRKHIYAVHIKPNSY